MQWAPQISARLRADDRTDASNATDPLSTAEPPPVPPPDPTPSPPPQPAPKTIVNGRPTNAHPWNRRFLLHRPNSPAEI
jgi:hypothetical protein